MAKVGIVTDSTNCLPPDLIDKYHIRVIPVGMVIDGKRYRDQIDITLEQFNDMFPRLAKQPTTFAANPGDFLTAFNELSQSTNDIICILVSKVLTATQDSAYQARRLIREEKPNLNIEIIDSKTSAGALGFIVLEAARAAQENKSLKEIVRLVQDMLFRVVYLAALDTLKYLIQTGRAPKSTSLAEMFDVKPVIGFVDDTGLIEVVSRVRGKQRSLSTLVNLIAKYVDTSKPLHAMVHYSNGRTEAEELRDLISSRYQCAEMYVTEYTPVMVSATGHMVGLSVYSD